jgi:hypothetical protein
MHCSNEPLLFDHLVGTSKQWQGNREAEHLRGPEVDEQLEFGRLLDGQVFPACELRRRHEGSHFLEKSLEGGLVIEEQVIPAGERDEPGTRNPGGHPAAGIERNTCVVTGVHHQSGDRHLGKQIRYIDIAVGFEISHRVSGTPGMNCEVKSWRNAGSLPGPIPDA